MFRQSGGRSAGKPLILYCVWAIGRSKRWKTIDFSFVDLSKGLKLGFKFPWAGAYDGNDKDYNVVDNGFEVGNFQVNLNKIHRNTSNLYYGSEFSINFSIELNRDVVGINDPIKSL